MGTKTKPKRRGHRTALLAGLTAFIVLLAGAVVAFGVPGTGFAGLLGRSSQTASPLDRPDLAVPPVASLTYGTQQTWAATPESLVADVLPAGAVASDVSLNVISSSGPVWLVEAHVWGEWWMLLGVDAATGAKVWSSHQGSPGSCVESDAEAFACIDGGGRYFTINVRTGEASKGVELFTKATLGNTNGRQISIPEESDYSEYSVWTSGDLVIARFVYEDQFLLSRVTPQETVTWTAQLPIDPHCADDYCGNESKDGTIIVSGIEEDEVYQETSIVLDAETGKELFSAPAWMSYGDGREILVEQQESFSETSFADSSGNEWKVRAAPSASERLTVYFGPGSKPLPLTGVENKDSSILQLWPTGAAAPTWTREMSGSGYVAAYDGSRLLLLDWIGNLWSLSPDTGEVLWHTDLPMPDFLTRAGPELYLFEDGTALVSYWSVFVYDADTGTLQWTHDGGDINGDFWNINPGGFIQTWAYAENNSDQLARLDPALPAPRTPSMPEQVPSCPDGWTPTAWSTWADGNLVVCYTRTKPDLAVLTDASGSHQTATATREGVGGFTATFGSRTVSLALGGGLVTIDGDDQFASAAWVAGRSAGFAVPRPANLSECTDGARPASLSIWGPSWLLTCAKELTTGNFSYFDGEQITTGTIVDDGFSHCSPESDTFQVCVMPYAVVVTKGEATTAYPTVSSYLPRLGQQNSPALTLPITDSQDEASKAIDAQIAHDSGSVAVGEVSLWTPQLSAKWDGIVTEGKTWRATDIWAQFKGFKDKYPTALLLDATEWSSLGLSGQPWRTMVAGVGFDESLEANRWCHTNGFTPDTCMAVRVNNNDQSGNVVNWKVGDFG